MIVEAGRWLGAPRAMLVEQRAVIVLHYHLGLPLAEAAPILEIPVGTASSRLHRGLAALRAALDAEPEATNVMASERGP